MLTNFLVLSIYFLFVSSTLLIIVAGPLFSLLNFD
jgi:hypothetical protein